MGYRPDNPAGDALGQALGRQQAIVQHMRARAHRRGGGRPRDRASLPGLGHHQAGVRVPGADAARSGEVRLATWDRAAPCCFPLSAFNGGSPR